MKSKLTLAFVIPAALVIAACTDYLDEFKDEYDETFAAIDEPSPGDDDESSSSETKAGSSSSTKLSSDGKGSEPADGSNSSGKVGSSSSTKGTSSSSAGSSSSQNTSSDSMDDIPLSAGVFGTCKPVRATFELDERVTWSFTWNTESGGLSAIDRAKAKLNWDMPGGSPATYDGDADDRFIETSYTTSGPKTATVSVTAGGSTQEISCTPVKVSGDPITGCQCVSTNISPDVSLGEKATWTISGCTSASEISYKWTGATANTAGNVATADVSAKGERVTGVFVTVSNTDYTSLDVTCDDAVAVDQSSPEIIPNRVGPVSQYGRLIAGKNSSGKGGLYGSCEGVKDGGEVQVRGMSLYWSLMSNAMEFWTEEGITTMVNDMNIEVVRAAMAAGQENWSDEWNDIPLKGYSIDPTNQKSFVKNVVEAAIKNDIYVIIDWHIMGADGYTTKAVEFFEYAAKEFGGYDNVIFEVWSEPTTVEMSTVTTHANQVIAAIRKYSDNLVLVGSPSWSAQPSACAAAAIQDSEKNYACTLHFYAGTHLVEGTHDAAAEQAMSSGVPVFVSEWGTVNSDGKGGYNESSSRAWTHWMEQKGISWTAWNASKVNETSAAFTSSATKTSLQYTTSGSLVKSFLAANPTSYTACQK